MLKFHINAPLLASLSSSLPLGLDSSLFYSRHTKDGWRPLKNEIGNWKGHLFVSTVERISEGSKFCWLLRRKSRPLHFKNSPSLAGCECVCVCVLRGGGGGSCYKTTFLSPSQSRCPPPRYIWNQDGRPYRKVLDLDDLTRKKGTAWTVSMLLSSRDLYSTRVYNSP